MMYILLGMSPKRKKVKMFTFFFIFFVCFGFRDYLERFSIKYCYKVFPNHLLLAIVLLVLARLFR